MTVSTVKRSQFKTFLNTGTAQSPVWSLIGDGVTSAKISYNPKTLEQLYIHQSTGTTEIESYRPTLPIEAVAKQGDPAFNLVDNLRVNRAVLDSAYGEIVNVWLYETPVGGAYPAERQQVSIQLEDFGGDGGTAAKINYTINFMGEPVVGTFNPSTLAFTANPNVALLTSLALGGLTLDPAFTSAYCLYTAATSAATNTITAASIVSGATVVIMNGATTITSGAAATWVTGVNHVTITVSVAGSPDGVYRVDVTKS